MFFAPHTLQIKSAASFERDEYGRPVSENQAVWKTVGACRCDDVSAERSEGDNGAVYPYRFKVVYPKALGFIAENTEVQCLEADGTVRGSGVVKSPMKTNWLSYRVIWLE